MKGLLVFALLFVSLSISAQNLVSNGGFEDENICTEYTKNCAPEAWIATSLTANYFFDDSVNAFSGRHFVGISAGNLYRVGVRNFIRSRLVCGLQPGHQYKVEFAIRSRHWVLDSIGVYFSENDFLFEKTSFRQIIPQLWSADIAGNAERLPSVWHQLSFIYTATGKEGYITIGNFKREDHKKIKSAEYKNDYYFFLDEISVTAIDPDEKICLQADSVRSEIYSENERHDLLMRKIYLYTKRPPAVLPLPKTIQAPPQVIDTLIIPDIFFETASYALNAKSHQALDSFANAVRTKQIDSIVIEGHTDSVGKYEYNLTLSVNRANSVKDYLLNHQLAKGNLYYTRGYSYLKPVADNQTARGRSQNRRVELFLYRRR